MCQDRVNEFQMWVNHFSFTGHFFQGRALCFSSILTEFHYVSVYLTSKKQCESIFKGYIQRQRHMLEYYYSESDYSRRDRDQSRLKSFIYDSINSATRFPSWIMEKRFSGIISIISPSFVSIYNQARQAEYGGLADVCGTGYRRALEFLIKDFLIYSGQGTQEDILKDELGLCLRKYDFGSPDLKEVAKRAVWLGNDEGHCERKWEGFDVKNLKEVIDLLTMLIDAKVRTMKLLEAMPAPRK